jgi:hypothetical protein
MVKKIKNKLIGERIILKITKPCQEHQSLISL